MDSIANFVSTFNASAAGQSLANQKTLDALLEQTANKVDVDKALLVTLSLLLARACAVASPSVSSWLQQSLDLPKQSAVPVVTCLTRAGG